MGWTEKGRTGKMKGKLLLHGGEREKRDRWRKKRGSRSSYITGIVIAAFSLEQLHDPLPRYF